MISDLSSILELCESMTELEGLRESLEESQKRVKELEAEKERRERRVREVRRWSILTVRDHRTIRNRKS